MKQWIPVTLRKRHGIQTVLGIKVWATHNREARNIANSIVDLKTWEVEHIGPSKVVE